MHLWQLLVLAVLGACAASPETDCPALLAGPLLPDAGPCRITPGAVQCDAATFMVDGGGQRREVTVALPRGDAPDAGWPTVIAYQGSFLPAGGFFSASAATPFGGYQEALTVAALLGSGFAVIAPNTEVGQTFWLTNVPPWSVEWSGCPDDLFLGGLFAAVDAGALGPLDGRRLFAMGISSGGYMTSRMAVSYAGRFRALAIASASYATCAGAACVVPPLPADHPPTLFLHGLLDTAVPVATMEQYRSALKAHGRKTCEILDRSAGHQWLDEAPLAVPSWFAGQ